MTKHPYSRETVTRPDPAKSYLQRNCPGLLRRLGVTIALCCHNSAALLPKTLAYVKRQLGVETLNWEVVLIDNASTDGTESVAREAWGDDGPSELRVIQEPCLGLSYARERAFREARYEIVSFVDDDNLIEPHWVATVSDCFSSDPDLGAIASVNTAVADIRLPNWFSRYCAYYAAWAFRESADLPDWILSGAGMSIRRSAWLQLRQNGFQWRLKDRTGTRLSSCGDLEIGYALNLAGWKTRLERRLKLEHYMTPERLQWSYLRRLMRGCGEGYVILDSYLLVEQGTRPTLINRLRQCWWVRATKEALQLVCSYSPVKLGKSFYFDMEDDDDVAAMEFRLGRLLGLLRLRSRYGQFRRDVIQAPWRKISSWDAITSRP